MTRQTKALIDLDAILHNFKLAEKWAIDSDNIAVIKANAYGHGALETAKALQEADAYAVSCIPEAVALRESGTQHPILVLQGHQNIDEH